jgi:1-phosphatidylinositol-3-phosphate 5-kinase
MLSLGKFLELLVYAPALCIMRPALCEHTAPPAEPVPDADRPLPRARFNVVRFFGVGVTAVSFALSRVEDVFELCVPRIQITRSGAPEKSAHGESSRLAEDEEKRLLRAEIKAWWQGVAEHLDRLVSATGRTRERC